MYVITSSRQRLTEQLSMQQTEQLLQQVNRAYNTEINDILLSAMLLALNEVQELTVLNLMLESHGREAINENLDISKTMGWFTSMYPAVLQAASEAIKAI